MNAKINTTCFILLFLFLITAVSAADVKNETILTAQQPDSNQELNKLSTSKTTVKEKVTLSAPDLKMYYKDGSKFKATVKNKNKKAITKAKVDFTVNGKVYSKQTDSKGNVYLTISLKSGNYPITTKFAGTSKYSASSKKSTITVKSTIKCSDFKKYYNIHNNQKSPFGGAAFATN